MTTLSRQFEGKPIVYKVVNAMEEMMQAFAVRAACFVGECDVPYSVEFDGRDFGAIHLLARVGEEPVGTLRLRWFKSFAMAERLSVIGHFRGHGIGRRLLELGYAQAEERGCHTLYCRTALTHVDYFRKQGWICHDDAGGFPKESTVALIRATQTGRPASHLDPTDSRALSELVKPAQGGLKAAA